jgi:NodT family efflux transporter outer membrane factor (OMF) lipoprotein
MQKILFIFIILLNGCSLAPDYERPAMDIPDDYKEQGDWLVADPKAVNLSRGPWWEMYNDPILNDLMLQVTKANQDLKLALARYDEAKAVAAVAYAQLFPQIDAIIVPSWQEVSKNTANPAHNPLFTDVFVGVDLSYEIDVWGQIRNNVVATKKQAQASQAQIAVAELSLHALLANYYFTLRSVDLAQAILDEVVKAYEKALYLNKMLFEGGAAPAQTLYDSQAQLESAKTIAIDLQLTRAQLEHAIAVLVGKVPAQFDLPVINDYQQTLVLITPDLPSTLLERRPDIAAAELQVQAANANIGVTRAAFFPEFNMVATVGVESTDISNLFSEDSLVWALGLSSGPSELGTFIAGPTVQQIIYDGGAIASLNEKAWAQYHETVANYRQTVLSAYQEVEDNLVAMHKLAAEDVTQTAANTAAHKSLDQAFYRYKAGLTTYLDVVFEQYIALQNDLTLIHVRTRHQLASVQLIKALGGGWQTDYEN